MMPDAPPALTAHATLEAYRRLGLDALQDPVDDSVKWRPIIFCLLSGAAGLAAFITLWFVLRSSLSEKRVR